MGASHHHHPAGGHSAHSATGNLKLAFFLNLGFTLIEFIGGILTNSTAILADAIHDLGDSFALGQAWYFESLSRKGRTNTYTYGYRRFTLLGALLSALLLLLSSLFILSEALPRLLEPEAAHPQGMLLLALLGIVVNGLAMLRLSRSEGANIRVVALHLLEDVLGWVAILIVAVVLMFWDLPFLDPLLAILITLYILVNVIKQLKQLLPVFLQASPASVDLDELEKQLLSVDQVASVHHLHLWSLDGEQQVLSAHLVTAEALDATAYETLKKRLREVIDGYPVQHSTLEIEWPEEICRLEVAEAVTRSSPRSH
ncbi:cation diffusion facilitator family transporter [Marinospirillum perlucidum]|uniref:cation diffusion facilitator family transporter n=1 Tax=Marinospirillum perlucidum TaxID=1982602 RepID=UPI000DF3D93B|nr:cation diffusion facilitator family transporter [Marinospirillum perlucidum]